MERILGSNNIAEVKGSVDKNLQPAAVRRPPAFSEKRRLLDFSLVLLWRGRTAPYRDPSLIEVPLISPSCPFAFTIVRNFG
jgi:hypothetical protein